MYRLTENDRYKIKTENGADFTVLLTFVSGDEYTRLYVVQDDHQYILLVDDSEHEGWAKMTYWWPPEVCGAVFMEDLKIKNNNNIRFD